MENRGEFGVQETVESDGHVRLLLVGELDHATAQALAQRLDQLRESGSPVRLDLSELEFIDSSGIRALIVGLRDARQEGWELEVERSVSWQVERVITVLGIDSVLWPDAADSADGSA
ncbi:MAG TPA: STAS domain-containing protein [Solirubrobacteraceae bacterium]|nr:STAS domain-containing protein [Solirubrobacteraceae bacterium]